MLTVAQNLAMGHGFTIADGTIRTNGVQPLVTFVWAGVHWLTGGDRLRLRGIIRSRAPLRSRPPCSLRCWPARRSAIIPSATRVRWSRPQSGSRAHSH